MLREMAADERPREKLKLRGATALSDGDLLAIVLNTGIRGETVTDVAQRLLADCGGLRGLFRIDLAELARVRGVGDAKSVRLKAAMEQEQLRVVLLDTKHRIMNTRTVYQGSVNSEIVVNWGPGDLGEVQRVCQG